MKKHTQANHKSTISFDARFLLLIMLATLLSSCGTVIQAPSTTQSEQAQLTPLLTSIPATEAATQIPTPEINPSLETSSAQLNLR